ncbi:hypothetical protein [Candidatus Poriferisodalis sp.]|uniref:hypothetical protein n=1 Tax=Candidatus Poriferisodalis sp. TaxID=3101277 RepID=UPI003B022BAD
MNDNESAEGKFRWLEWRLWGVGMAADLPCVERHARQAVLNALDTSRAVMLHGA